jgi:diguanylate cyclase (GGDEF)-like protein/PAS domain S-box-containing protein
MIRRELAKPREKFWAVLLIVVLWLLSLLFVSKSFLEQKELYLEKQNSTQKIAWKAVESIHIKGVDAYFFSLKASKAVMDLLLLAQDPQQAKFARLSLYRLLYGNYQTLKQQGLSIFHFQDSQTRSFLRFHKPSRFGDDLSIIRPSLLRVKESLTPLHGFEVGLLQSGFRHIYPIQKNDQFLGTVEFSQPFESLRKEMALLDDSLEYGLIHKKSLLEFKMASNADNIYAESAFSDEWLEEDPLRKLSPSSAIMSSEMRLVGHLAKRDRQVVLGLTSGQSFSQVYFVKGTYKVLNFIAINDVSHENNAYLVSYRLAKDLDRLLRNSLIFALMATIIALVLGFIALSWVSAKRAQQKSLDFLELINETMAQGLYVVNSKGLITEINSAALTFLGLTKQAVLGKRAHDLFHVDRMEPGGSQTDCYLEGLGKSGFSGELQFLNHVQNPCWVRVNSRQLLEGTKNLGNVVMFHDISTERKNAESLRVAATAFETQEGIIITDIEGIILQVNSAFSRLTGYSSEEAVGVKPGVLLHSGMQSKDFYAEMWTVLKAKQSWQGEVRNCRKDGIQYLEWLTVEAVQNEKGEVSQYVGSFSDITERKKAQDEIFNLAFYDPLTQLPNRRLLKERLNHALLMSERLQQCGGLIFIDLDDFKTLNDTKGHSMGDELLVEVARRLQASVREMDTVARLGGDEFVVLLTDLGPIDQDAISTVQVVANHILESFTEGFKLSGGVYRSTPSLGVEMFLGKILSDEEIIMHADMAMYQAKKAGRNRVCFFNPQMQEKIERAQAFEEDMAVTIETGFTQLELYYQAQVDLHSKVQSVEALIRWHHPQKGMVSPVDFIPMIEGNGQILPVGGWILRTACAQLFKWQSNALSQHLTLAVNVSAKQLLNADFVTQLQEIVVSSGINPSGLKIELTESSVVHDIDKAIAVMNAIRGLGIELSMDDFGTGYSSLTYLKRLPLSQLKIDQSFVRDLEHDADSLAIVQTILAMAKTLKLTVVAEGVETLKQKELLELDGCQLFQGYYYSRPVPVEAFDKLLG